MRKQRPPAISDDDTRLFREAIGEVRRIEAEPPLVPVTRPSPHPHMRDADEAAVSGELLSSWFDPGTMEIGEELSFLRDGYPPTLLKKLKRGAFSIQAETDLHRMNAEAARLSILELLGEARREGWRCVRIIHGKGLRSRPGGPVLKGVTDHMLRRRDEVLAFASARPAQGGTGAVIVLLKSR